MSTNLFTFEKLPVLLSSTSDKAKNDAFYDFTLVLDEDTGLVYQKNIPPQDILYKDARNSGMGKIWKDHYDKFYEFIVKNIDLNDKKICEIGSGNGYVAKKIGKDYKIDCYEPNPTFESTDNINLIKDFMNFETGEQYDVILLSHTFEHITNPEWFLQKLKGSLNPNGFLVMSYPNFEMGLKNNLINLFNSEHISYLSKSSTEKILNKNYFQNCLIEEYIDHSIFVIGQSSDSNHYEKLTTDDVNEIKVKIFDYLVMLNEKIKNTVKLISNHKEIYIFGCHAMSSIFLHLSCLTPERFLNVLDNDPLKDNTRLYGTNLICLNPKNAKKSNVLLNGGVYHSEIKESLLRDGFNVIEWI